MLARLLSHVLFIPKFTTRLTRTYRSRSFISAIRAFEEEFADFHDADDSYSQLLDDCQPGDVIFFGKRRGGNDFEQAVLDVTEGDFFHAGIIANDQEIFHASNEGVEKISIKEAIRKIDPHYLEICSVSTSAQSRLSALSFCTSVDGWSYNDIFSPSKVDSQGRPALYCSQLITEAYPEIEFPDHKMSFRNQDGKLISHWIQYYRERGHPIPHGQPGSHPSIIRKAPALTQLKLINIDSIESYSKRKELFINRPDLNNNIAILNAFK